MNDRQIDRNMGSGQGAPRKRTLAELIAGIAVLAWAAISAIAAEV